MHVQWTECPSNLSEIMSENIHHAGAFCLSVKDTLLCARNQNSVAVEIILNSPNMLPPARRRHWLSPPYRLLSSLPISLST